MKKFLFNWLVAILLILIIAFFIIGIPFLLDNIGLPYWVSVVYLFVFGSIVLALSGMKD